jgi:hypothetical protein
MAALARARRLKHSLTSQCALGGLNDTAGGNPFGVQAMIQDVSGALWFITLLIVVFGMASGDLCLWRRDD